MEVKTSQADQDKTNDNNNDNNDNNESTVSPSLVLVSSIIQHHHNNLHQIQTKLKELLQHEVVLIEGLQSENERFKEAETTFNLPALFQEVGKYNHKLSHLKSEMTSITERTARLKRRASRLQQQQQQKALDQEQQRARLADQEKHLIARPAWDTNNQPS
ncbi:hypothetical protein Pmani_018275 [Petrolisthes manimaculis]|uniref:Biogenesis of lysosome-related organelles complex 1 subunit 6 n=1 Tax=Petrolisthes manimaculis TaxID=1843537 RepID=A0AAE1PLS7_9EUCA|nr:hypothetical protein Pmani_018275 [Petrolisthes manimaculis]